MSGLYDIVAAMRTSIVVAGVVTGVVAGVLATVLAACKPAEKPEQQAAPAKAIAPAPHDEKAIVERTTQLFRAADMADVDAVAAMLAPGFLRAGMARFFGKEVVLQRLRTRKERGFPRISERTFDLTKVRFFGDSAVYTAMTTAKLVRAEGAASITIERSETLVWTWHEGAWLLANWQEEPAGAEADRASWNETFRESSNLELKPNHLLVETVHGRKPGKALDVGIGQGRNALFLAAQGWDVTGVDISDEGIRQAQEAAKAAGLTLHTEIADIDTWDWGQAKYDLVCLIYMGSKPPVDKIRRALVPGGIVVIEFFLAEATAGTGMSGFKPGELPLLFKDGFKVLRYEEAEDVADWGLRRVPLARFVAEKI